MKQKIKNILKYAVPIAVLVLPFAALAANAVQTGLSGSGLSSSFGNAGSLSGSGDLSTLIANVIRLALLFAGAIAVLFIIIGGYQYVTSAGNEESAEKGKKTLINAIIGIVIIVLSYVIVNVIARQVGG